MSKPIKNYEKFEIWNHLNSLVTLLEDKNLQDYKVSNFEELIPEKRNAVDKLREIFENEAN